MSMKYFSKTLQTIYFIWNLNSNKPKKYNYYFVSFAILELPRHLTHIWYTNSLLEWYLGYLKNKPNLLVIVVDTCSRWLLGYKPSEHRFIETSLILSIGVLWAFGLVVIG